MCLRAKNAANMPRTQTFVVGILDNMSVVDTVEFALCTIHARLSGKIIMDMSLALINMITAVTAYSVEAFRFGLYVLHNCGNGIVVLTAGGETKGCKQH